MAELRQSLHSLVECPTARPLPVEVVAARSTRYARRRRARLGAGGLALVAAASIAGIGVSRQDSEPGVLLSAGGRTTAGYVAERPGGYLAAGTWTVTITRSGQVIELSSTSGDPCGPMGTIRPGDEVRGSITGPGSSLRVGERFACPR
jgi:hypothetical protein